MRHNSAHWFRQFATPQISCAPTWPLHPHRSMLSVGACCANLRNFFRSNAPCLAWTRREVANIEFRGAGVFCCVCQTFQKCGYLFNLRNFFRRQSRLARFWACQSRRPADPLPNAPRENTPFRLSKHTSRGLVSPSRSLPVSFPFPFLPLPHAPTEKTLFGLSKHTISSTHTVNTQ